MNNALTLTKMVDRIRSGDLSSEALVSACLDRIAAREDQIGAWQYLDAEGALQAARKADRMPRTGALHGIPIAVKDIIDTHDMPTGLGFAPYRDRRTSWDASCVSLCRRAGAIVVGKTVTTEFAYFAPGKTRNPHNIDFTPGGSSSGSAASVADFMVPVAFGSQTAASLTRPAAFCGVVGYKASHSEFSLSGIRPFSETFDSLGLFTRAVSDIPLMRDVLLGRHRPTPRKRASAPRIGFCRTFHWDEMEPVARELTEKAIANLADAGAMVEEIDLPKRFAILDDVHKEVMAYEAGLNYTFEQLNHSEALSQAFTDLCNAGNAISQERHEAAQLESAYARDEFKALFRGYDAWIAPSALGEAPRATDGTGNPIMSRLWTLLQGPSISVPIGFGHQGLPVGMQLVGPAGTDDMLIQVAAWVETHLATGSEAAQNSASYA